jgi:hypothetical protein
MILSVGFAPSLPGESYALLPDAVKNHAAHSFISQMVQTVTDRGCVPGMSGVKN